MTDSYQYFTDVMSKFKVKTKLLIELMHKYRNGLLGDKMFFMVKYYGELKNVVRALDQYLQEFEVFIEKMEKINTGAGGMKIAEEDAKVQIATEKAKAKQAASAEVQAKNQQEEIKKLKEQNLLFRIILEKRNEMIAAAKNDAPPDWEKMEYALLTMDDSITLQDARRILKPLREQITEFLQNDAPETVLPKTMKQVHRILCVDFEHAGKFISA